MTQTPAARRLSSLAPLAFALALTGAPACAKADAPSAEHTAAAPAVQAAPGGHQAAAADPGKAERKVIKNAELHIEAGSPAEARQKAADLVECEGGYVADTSESHHGGRGDEQATVRLTLKVPADRLNKVIAGLKGLGSRVTHEHIGSQDVSAEFYDLEARLKAQRAVEAQFLEIAKDARTVPDLLAVQQKLGEVRAEIERMEGRRNQINSQVSLSTVQLSIQGEQSRSSIAATVSKAGGDAVAVGSALVHGGIRTAGVLLPLALFFGPLGYLAVRLSRVLLRRLSRA